MSQRSTETNIFLIEDNPGDVKLITSQLKNLMPSCRITTAHDGEEALKMLLDGSAGRSFPELIIMDLNLPKMTGHEVLAELKKDSRLRAVPVVIFSSSASPKDITKAYENHGNCYIVKPFDYHDFNEAIRQVHEFWFQVSKLPNQKVA